MSSRISVDRSSLVLAAMTAGGQGSRYHAVQLMNLLLLIDREVAADIGGPYFDFEPHPYGPYDGAVLATVESLAAAGSVLIDETGPYWECQTSGSGFVLGQKGAVGMPRHAAKFIRAAAEWVLSKSFWSLLGGIYQRYPDMAVNGQIPPYAVRDARNAEATEMHPFLRGMAQAIGILRHRDEPEVEDPDPIAADWMAVGNDLRRAMDRVLRSPGPS